MLRGIYLVCCFILSTIAAHATHLRAGNIIVKRVGDCSARKYSITVIAYTNTLNTNVLFGGDQDYLDFGDKSPRVLVPEIGPGHPNYTVIDAQRGIARAFYTIEWTYPGPGRYTISYVEPNRNEGVVNMDNSVNTTFYIETQIVIDPFLGCSTPPDLLIPPIDRACSGKAFYHNPGAYDPDGDDSLSYEMVIPFRDRNATVLNYVAPNAQKFYTDYATGNETDDGPPTFGINPLDGTITWNAPGAAGEYNIAFIVKEWRKVLGKWIAMGYVRRDMQIIVEDDCNNQRPDLQVPKDICIEAGKTLKETIIGTDPDGDKVKIEAFSQIFEFIPTESPATVSPDPAVFQNTPGKLNFVWNTTCDHVREQPYQVVFKVSDSHSGNGVSLVTYKTWRIKVVAPAPTWKDAQLDVSKRTATIKWDPYYCTNAEKIQIWRKVDSTSFRPDSCETGMPPGLGYTNIATIAAKTATGAQVSQYIDTNDGQGLAPGAMYCYRIVATFALPEGGESYVSKDTCVGPIPADVPIITNVSVVKTGTADGQMRVSWKRPFDADKALYPPPYKYEVYRATGYTRSTDSTLVATLNGDTTFIDQSLNTEETVYNYSVVAYSPNSPLANKFVGASEVASAVRLDSKSQVGQIQLNWTAVVPWSNQIQAYPRHLIYRGEEGVGEENLVLIDSIDALVDGLQYVDKGQYNNTPLDEGKTYCYKVMTRGGYGNPKKIPEPLLNFSQMICVQPGDSIPPCAPILSVDLLDCDQFKLDKNSCQGGTYTNTLTWSNDASSTCQADISKYRIYRSAVMGGDEKDDILIAEVDGTTTSYIDGNLPSFARCYRISAVDRSGNEGKKSTQVCNDNCPYYELPNVFTPNDDGKNDVFSAFNIREYLIGCGENCDPPQRLIEKCARFVEKVKFKVFNRWGQEVYSYESGSENSIYIDWNGRDSKGVKLSPAVYYYVAEVTFTTLDPGSSNKTFKGWVHLVDGGQ
ncbi:gliding motility-associated C-terminal domain-containing protein [Ohtaekwangia sp.]|uniref:T9SS type B sorting domain-containing protein n=1 Tax=Ohtaekwangia sp. TaxID=2066019 RepID=UPI002FDD04E1